MSSLQINPRLGFDENMLARWNAKRNLTDSLHCRLHPSRTAYVRWDYGVEDYVLACRMCDRMGTTPEFVERGGED